MKGQAGYRTGQEYTCPHCRKKMALVERPEYRRGVMCGIIRGWIIGLPIHFHGHQTKAEFEKAKRRFIMTGVTAIPVPAQKPCQGSGMRVDYRHNPHLGRQLQQAHEGLNRPLD